AVDRDGCRQPDEHVDRPFAAASYDVRHGPDDREPAGRENGKHHQSPTRCGPRKSPHHPPATMAHGSATHWLPTHCEPTHCEPTHCEPTHCEPTHCEPTHW